MNKIILFIFALVFTSILSINLKQIPDPNCNYTDVIIQEEPSLPPGSTDNGDAKGNSQDI